MPSVGKIGGGRMRWCCCVLVLFAIGCAGHPGGRWVEGGLYASRQDDGSLAVVKVLKLDDIGVHVRVYSNRFDSFPETLDESTLYLAGIDHGPDEQLGMGHLPLSRPAFAAWKPALIKVVPVADSELDGYREWREANGGYF